ncbi:hypothetical protein MMC07_001662 [Pseudocyphellaria aurata]|nr:hypothetical protein [Pseudocyphellaria aurata]
MADDGLRATQLDHLQSDDQLKLLDDIDKLRSQGISHYVSLPQLIVCGDQSSGKSSVLEAISGIPFPTKDNLCTRFATEVILRRTSTVNVSVAILPSQPRSESDVRRNLSFHTTLTDFEKFPEVIEAAKEAMGLSMTGSAFSNDVLRIEISGPDRPHLTIVDLPGLIHSENKLQTAADVELVIEMVRSYMSNRRSINLAVVSAKNDYANQVVLKMARKADPTGQRTMGVITKPDTLPVGSESETGFVNLARNEDIVFRLGWHVLRNRDYETKDRTREARDLTETNFFSQGAWKSIPRHSVGIAALRERLSTVLLEQVKTELPSLVTDVQTSIEDCETRLDKLGSSRTSTDDQRLFLLRISQAFQLLSRAAMDGTYGDPFFGDPRSIEGYCKRLRAVIQNLNLNFAESMRMKGHSRLIVEGTVPRKKPPKTLRDTSSRPHVPELIGRGEFINDIRDLLKKSRGRELPGMFNPLIISDLFCEQSKPWEALARQHLQGTWDAARAYLELTVSHLTDETTSKALFREIIDPRMDDKLVQLYKKLDELLDPYRSVHPITYNHYFTETIQSVRQERHQKDIERRLNTFLSQTAKTEIVDVKSFSPKLVSALSSRNEADMDRNACSEILDCMEAYYKVAMKNFIDNVAIQAVEGYLIRGLDDIISPSSILQMEPGLVGKIAAESCEHQLQRDELLRKSTVLKMGLITCKRYVGRSASTLRVQVLQDTEGCSPLSAAEDQDSEVSSTPKPAEILKCFQTFRTEVDPINTNLWPQQPSTITPVVPQPPGLGGQNASPTNVPPPPEANIIPVAPQTPGLSGRNASTTDVPPPLKGNKTPDVPKTPALGGKNSSTTDVPPTLKGHALPGNGDKKLKKKNVQS